MGRGADDDLRRAPADVDHPESALRPVTERGGGADERESRLLLPGEDPHPEPAGGLDRAHELRSVRGPPDGRCADADDLARAELTRMRELSG